MKRVVLIAVATLTMLCAVPAEGQVDDGPEPPLNGYGTTVAYLAWIGLGAQSPLAAPAAVQEGGPEIPDPVISEMHCDFPAGLERGDSCPLVFLPEIISFRQGESVR